MTGRFARWICARAGHRLGVIWLPTPRIVCIRCKEGNTMPNDDALKLARGIAGGPRPGPGSRLPTYLDRARARNVLESDWLEDYIQRELVARLADAVAVAPGACWHDSGVRWPEMAEGTTVRCELRAGHLGAHEADRGARGGTATWLQTYYRSDGTVVES